MFTWGLGLIKDPTLVNVTWGLGLVRDLALVNVYLVPRISTGSNFS